MPLHIAKKTALLNSLNCISSNDLTSLKDLSDGSCLYNILSTTFKESSDHVEECESDISVSVIDRIDNEKSKSGPANTSVTEPEDVALSDELLDVDTVESENAVTKEYFPVCAFEQIESPDGVDKVILQRYSFIQNFIDRRYNLKSDEIVSYSKCIKANEFELAKVAVFILSEVVRHFVLINNDHLRTLALLDTRMQEDLEECFHLFIAQREEISKKDVEKILSSHAKYKSRSPKSPFSTPRRNCASKYKVDFPTTPSTEEIYTNSPLKSFFESPVFKKEDILRKDRELARTRNNLHEEEIKADELRLELTEAKKTIDLKEKEIASLKATMKMRDSDENFQVIEDELKKVREEYDSLKKESEHKYKRYEAEISKFMKDQEFLKFEANAYRSFSIYSSMEDINLYDELRNKDELLGKRDAAIEVYRRKQEALFSYCNNMQTKLHGMEADLKAEKQKSRDLEIQAAKERECYAAKLCELKNSIKKEPESPGIGENIGDILEEENRTLQLELDATKLQNKQLVEALQQAEQQNVPNLKQNAFYTSNVDVMVLPNTPKIQFKSKAVVSDLINWHSDKCKELNDSLADMSNSEAEMIQDSSSSSLNAEVFNNMPELPVLKDYGALWENVNDSCLEIDCTDRTECIIESSDQSESCDKILNLCSKCNMPSKNGYNLNAVFAQKLEEKDKVIANLEKEYKTLEHQSTILKDKCDTLEQRAKEYLRQIAENDTTINKLKMEVNETKKELKDLKLLHKKCGKSPTPNEELSMKFNELFMKCNLSQARFREMKKLEKYYQYEIETLKSLRRKKEQELICMKERSTQMIYRNITLERKIRSQEQEIHLLKSKLLQIEGLEKRNQDSLKCLNVNKQSKNVKEVEISPEDTKEQLNNVKLELHFAEFNTNASKDIINESTVSGALHRKNGISIGGIMNGEDEDSILNHTSLPCHSEQEKRMEELIRRNSVLPYHLQSAYPVECNLECSEGTLYVKKTESADNVKCNLLETNENLHNGHSAKKRKIHEVDSQSIELTSTPITKGKRIWKTPSSLRTLLRFSRSKRIGSIKPKP